MQAGVKTKVITNNSRAIPLLARLEMAAHNAEAAEEAAAVARQLVPVDKGNLRKSIHVEKYPAQGSAAFISGDENAPYAEYVEFGTVNSDAQPFHVPAVESAMRGRRSGVRTRRNR